MPLYSIDMQQTGKLIIVSGPSGVGKGTILKRVFAESNYPLVFSVSATTRKIRPGEVNGVNYWFLTPEDFESKRENGEFLECFQVFGGAWYGTLRKQVLDAIAEGKWVVLEIDVQGAKKIFSEFTDAISVFIEPKSVEVLKERLIGRGTETEEIMRQRLDRALLELQFAYEYK
ncbi:MAG: guanylate kinase, partial [Thermoguttaceae bacterium]